MLEKNLEKKIKWAGNVTRIMFGFSLLISTLTYLDLLLNESLSLLAHAAMLAIIGCVAVTVGLGQKGYLYPGKEQERTLLTIIAICGASAVLSISLGNPPIGAVMLGIYVTTVVLAIKQNRKKYPPRI